MNRLKLSNTIKEMKPHIGNRIKAFRLSKGMSTKGFGEELKLDRSSIFRWEKGEIAPPTEMVYLMAVKLGLNPLFVLLLSDVMYEVDLIKRKPVDIDILRKSMGGRLALLRNDKNITLETIGSLIGLTRYHVSNVESGNYFLQVKYVYELAMNFNFNPLYLLALSDEMYLEKDAKKLRPLAY